MAYDFTNFDPNQREWWQHYAMDNIFSSLGRQFGQLPGALDAQESARMGMNALLTPSGRAGQVKRFRRGAQRSADAIARRRASQLRAAGFGNQDAASSLAASNEAARATNRYQSDAESPDSLAQIFKLAHAMNSPGSILSSLGPLMQLESARLGQAGLREQQREKGGGFFGELLGGVLGGLPWSSWL